MILTGRSFRALGTTIVAPFASGNEQPTKANATFITLARNEELPALAESIKNYEAKFNSKFHYDWVFLNNEPFPQEFIETVSGLVSGGAHFGEIPREQWSIPQWIDDQKAHDSWEQMTQENVLYAGMESYHHMCRYESGFFYHHPLMQKYRYYWRVEPGTRLLCDVDYDVLQFMQGSNKKYGFTIALYEWERTVRTLWNSTLQFVAQYPEYVHPDNLIEFVADSNDNYNMCHFWSNFEIADMDFWRGEIYSKYFEYLDRAGGFFYERWGDAPIHSLAVALFLDKKEIHYFDDIGYVHHPNQHCPAQQKVRGLKCDCEIDDRSFDWQGASCLDKYYRAKNIPFIKAFWE